jgi:iron-sulfur cluster assembly accessory protein
MEAPTTDVISISDKAERKIRFLAEKEGRAQAILRVRVTAGGCSGFSYHLSFEDAAAQDDQVVGSPDGVRVVIDPQSVPILAGSTLDFDDALMGGGLKMVNPQATHECACGESFSV